MEIKCPRCKILKPKTSYWSTPKSWSKHGKPLYPCWECRKTRSLKIKFGITLDRYKDILKLQNSRCAICGEDDLENIGRSLAVDHCHSTGLVRGLLCSNCNRGLGLFRDNPMLLREAIAYLEGCLGS